MNGRNGLLICLMAAILPAYGMMRPKNGPETKKNAATEVVHPSDTTASYHYTEGILHIVTGDDPARAVRAFEKVLEIDSTHAPSLFELAELTMDEPEKALSYSLRANAADTSNAWYRAQLGQLLIATERYDSALKLYESLLRMSPDNPDNYRLLAALYEQQKQPEKALAVLDSSENRIGKTEMLSSQRRQLLLNMHRYDLALNEALELVENYPYDEANLVALAELYAVLGKDSLAQDTYDKALAINPNNMQTIASLNDFYKKKKDNVRFLETAGQLFRSNVFPLEIKLNFFENLIKTPNFYRDYYFQLGNLASALAVTHPEDFRATELYARHLIAGGRVEEALKLYKSHRNDSARRKQIYTEIIGMEVYLERPDSVTLYTEEALAYFPTDPDLYIQKGNISLRYLKNTKAAETDYKTALKYADSDSLRSIVYGLLGDNAHGGGNDKACFKYFDKGLQADSTNDFICNNYSYFLSLRNERLDYALELARRAIRLSPNNPTYLDTYAWVLYTMGRYEEARVPMRQAVSLDRNNNPELMIHYGDILYALNDRFMASFYWKKALENGYDAQEVEKRLKQLE